MRASRNYFFSKSTKVILYIFIVTKVITLFFYIYLNQRMLNKHLFIHCKHSMKHIWKSFEKQWKTLKAFFFCQNNQLLKVVIIARKINWAGICKYKYKISIKLLSIWIQWTWTHDYKTEQQGGGTWNKARSLPAMTVLHFITIKY